MSGGSTQVLQDFSTPDRPLPKSNHGAEGNSGPGMSLHETANLDKANAAALVTPPDAAVQAREEAIKKEGTESPLQRVATDLDSPEDNKHVRFNKEMESKEGKGESVLDSPSSSSNGSQRGVVSRRGGRISSPGRNLNKAASTTESNVLEVKTYRSPPRREIENVPSLCSTSSSVEKEKAGGEGSLDDSKMAPIVKKEEAGTSSTSDNASYRPVSISCDASLNQTSPLTSDEVGQQTTTVAAPLKPKTEDGKKGTATGSRKNNVTFSPVPPPKQSLAVRTPTKSPTGGRFHNLPTLDDATLASPAGGIFLSPHPTTPSYRGLPGSESFDNGDLEKDCRKPRAKDPDENDSKEHNILTPKTQTPKREDHGRFLATPTDFTMDYGRPPNSGPFDSSNVLAWLQSPTANGLFSPGGFGSIMNTPRGAPRTPRTPTVSTSFFFSDVAALPRSGDVSPKPGGEGGKKGQQRGCSNIICISPLASQKAKIGIGKETNTPTINYKDMFASPAERNRGLALMDKLPKEISARTARGSATKDPSIDAVHMAERDLMEDEDLSVLLQLASNTPRGNGEHPVAVSTSDGTHVFRSSNGQTSGATGEESLPSLQLPVIGGRDTASNGTRLTRKTHSRDHGEVSDGLHRPLAVTSNGQAKNAKPRIGDEKGSGVKGKDKNKVDSSKKAKSIHAAPPPYGMPPHHYPRPDAPHSYYPPMPPGMTPHGSMRVVVGGPPPTRAPASASAPHGPPSPRSRPYPMGPGDPNYPPPPYPPPPGHYPHHPGVPPPPHMHPHYGHYPPPHHQPRPPHMPMYGAQHPPSKAKTPKKSPKQGKQGTKRPAQTPTPKSSAKKQKKSSPSSGAPKKKAKSPQITDKAERQKAAAAIQAVNVASGGKNDKAAALAAAILRGVTMRPSGKWQAQLYFAGKSRYIGVFDTREKAALAYEIAREKLKSEKSAAEGGTLTAKQTEAAVNAARKAAFEGVNESDPRLASK